jgi:hypothetical protein
MATVAPHERHSTVGRFFRNPETGKIVVFQMPNIPLWLFLATAATRAVLHPKGATGTAVSIVAGVSLAVWAILEIARGDSAFRRVLGAAVLAGAVLGYLIP